MTTAEKIFDSLFINDAPLLKHSPFYATIKAKEAWNAAVKQCQTDLDIILANADDDINRSSYPAQKARDIIQEELNKILIK